jgi:xanthine dehydrogenase accessory factor
VTAWIRAVQTLRSSRQPGVLVTVTHVRGHAPREAGAKMVVSASTTWGTIGGGNLEEEAVRQARLLLEVGSAAPTSFVSSLSDKAPIQHGVQCCGGEVTVLLEPIRTVPTSSST